VENLNRLSRVHERYRQTRRQTHGRQHIVNVIATNICKTTHVYTLNCTHSLKLDGCIVWNAHNTVLGEEARVIYIVPVCYVKTGRYGKT